MPFKVAIVGRPNVGKSTLFNRLVGQRVALVHDRPGVTRDRRSWLISGILDFDFELIDTAGLEEVPDGPIEMGMLKQTEKALAEANLVMMLFDARAGVTPLDEHFANLVRRSGKPVVLIANKCEGKAAEAGRIEAFSLGFGEPLPISAEHGQGIGYIYESINEHAEDFAEEEQGEEQGEELRPLQLALVGRPNVGKSTLVNALIEDERMLVSEVAGTTRDAIPVDWEWQGRKIRLVDTAGLRKKARIEDAVEKISASATINAVEKADIVILVLDADAILDKQDLVIASRIAEEGRGLVIAVNKWDAAEDRDASIKRLQDRIESSLSQFPNVPTVTISALRKKGLDKLMKAVLKVDEKWNARVSTGKLNRWFKKMLEANPPPRGKHAKQIKLRYITQTFTRPPSFVIFSSNPEGLPESYHRYLMNGLRETFEFAGVPIRISLRKNDNPYVDKED